jgi:hypothetical protein
VKIRAHGTLFAYAANVMLKFTGGLVVLSMVAACAQAQRQSGAYGSTHTHRSQLPPEKAARCFARNAEEHSSALVSEVATGREGRTEVTVRVKNGVTYATGDFRRAGLGSTGTITLMVVSSGRRGDLIDALTEGC